MDASKQHGNESERHYCATVCDGAQATAATKKKAKKAKKVRPLILYRKKRLNEVDCCPDTGGGGGSFQPASHHAPQIPELILQ